MAIGDGLGCSDPRGGEDPTGAVAANVIADVECGLSAPLDVGASTSGEKMEPLNRYPDVHLPRETMEYWRTLEKPAVFQALAMFASSQLVFGLCGPTDENLRSYCKCDTTTWWEIMPWVKAELEPDAEGKRGFKFVEAARLKGTIKSMEGMLAALVGRNPMMGSEVLPEKIQAVLVTLPAGQRLEVRGKLMRMMRTLQAAAVVRMADAKSREAVSVNALVEEEVARRLLAKGPALGEALSTAGPSGKPQGTLRVPSKPGTQVVDPMKVGAGYPELHNVNHPQAPTGASGGGGRVVTRPRRQRLTPPSNRSLPSLRRGSTMFPLRSDPRGGSGGELTKVLPMPAKSASKLVRPAAVAKRSRVVKLGSKLKKRTA